MLCDSNESTSRLSNNSIQAIDKDAVHRICSGQVVLNLATAVKELVENSLDAGASSIEIRLKEYGSELVEVIDNGSGVNEENFEGLTLKHHTSKLREFNDLLDVETFGFRGEALSSLCALSDMTVITRHSSSSLGTKLTFDARGIIASKIPCARQVGTTVSLSNLFSPLPVRQKEFLRNVKREFHKMTQLLYAYCLISRGVKILCTNQSKKGQKTVIASTQGSSTYKGNITCIFGTKQTNSLLDLEQKEPLTQHLEEIGLSGASAVGTFVLEGCISSCSHGQGRSAPDRQFYYINNRPCEPTKVTKVINEVYHQFNAHQFPFVFMNIKTKRSSVDVNVTPDKRQIFLEYEKLLLATVKASVLHLFENIPNTYQYNNVFISPATSTHSPALSSSPEVMTSTLTPSLGKFTSLLKTFRHSPSVNVEGKKEVSDLETENDKTRRGVKRSLEGSRIDSDGKKQLSLSVFVSSTPKPVEKTAEKENTPERISVPNSEICEENAIIPDTEIDFCEVSKQATENRIHESEEDMPVNTGDTFSECSDRLSIDELEYQNKENSGEILTECSLMNSSDVINNTRENHTSVSDQIMVDGTDTEMEPYSRKIVVISVSLDSIKNKCKHRLNSCIREGIAHVKGHGPYIRFYSDIDPSKNKAAESELQKEISKDMFAKMEILGQFNLGFIITKLGPDLFIVDQHATDEKYNFEMLQMHTTLQNQKLIIPQSLELTAANESILIENLHIFQKNGFSFAIDEEAEPSKRIQLTTKPVSHNWEFGKEDIDELLFMLQDSPHTMCRPSRVRAMFASRACRKSVMIGSALSRSVMRQLVNHMGEIEQPWNCPHGRPTMRHLINLELIKRKK